MNHYRNRTHDVLMILPRRAIRKPDSLPEDWQIDQDPNGLTLYINHMPACHAQWVIADDFGSSRPAIVFQNRNLSLNQPAFEALVSRLALAFDSIPSRNPLYIRFSKSDCDLIASASRIGFIPYFGKWKESSADDSQKSWEEITEQLRTDFSSQSAAA